MDRRIGDPEARVVIHPCPLHQFAHTTELRTGGLGGTEADQEHIMRTLMCGGCWGRDKKGLLRAMKVMGFSDRDIIITRSLAMQQK